MMRQQKREGLTKVEFLVVILVVVIGFGLLVVWTRQGPVRDGWRTQTINNMKQCCLAVHSANDALKKLPPATGTYGEAKKVYSLSVHLLPFIEQYPLYTQYAVPGSPMPSTAQIPPYNDPGDESNSDGLRVQNFAANVRVFTDIGYGTPYDSGVTNINKAGDGLCSATIPASFKVGISQSVMFSTRRANNQTIGANGNVNLQHLRRSGSGEQLRLLRRRDHDRPGVADLDGRLATRSYIGADATASSAPWPIRTAALAFKLAWPMAACTGCLPPSLQKPGIGRCSPTAVSNLAATGNASLVGPQGRWRGHRAVAGVEGTPETPENCQRLGPRNLPTAIAGLRYAKASDCSLTSRMSPGGGSLCYLIQA